MRTLIWICVVAASIAVGYGIRLGQEAPSKSRTTRDSVDPRAERTRVLASLTDEEREQLLQQQFPKLVRLREEEAERERARKLAAEAELPENSEQTEAELDAEAEAMMKQFRDAMKSQLPAWKASFSVNARATGRQIAKALGLEGEAAERFAAAFEKEGSRAAEEVMELFAGDFSGDPAEMEKAMDGFSWFMGSAGIMSDALAADISELVGDEGVGQAREEMRKRNKEHIDRQVDMQVRMMNLPDLSDRQKTELKEVFGGGGMMKEQSKVWGEIMKNPRKLMDADTDEKWAKVMEPSMKANRDRMRTILDDKQFDAYRKYETQMIQQSRVWLEPYMRMARSK